MAFTIPLTFCWLKHRLLTVQRILYRQSPVYFIKENPALSEVKTEDDKYILCPVCGFSMTEWLLADDWSVKACSAFGFNQVVGVSSLNQWLIEINKKQPDKTAITNHLSIKLK